LHSSGTGIADPDPDASSVAKGLAGSVDVVVIEAVARDVAGSGAIRKPAAIRVEGGQVLAAARPQLIRTATRLAPLG
jgi:hypothetical protein